jgi:L-malate glycosyltransferase
MRPVVFLWDNFGPMHVDRVSAVQTRLGTTARVVGVEIFARSAVYSWDAVDAEFERITLFLAGERPGFWEKVRAIWSAFRKIGRGDYFLCHYDRMELLVAAWMLRLIGSRVFTMGCSKFDDQPRFALRELAKSFFLKPYLGAIGSGTRSRDYFRFLGLPADKVVGGYNTVSIERFRRNAGWGDSMPMARHADAPFVAVARFVPKKNLHMLIEAFARYRAEAETPRKLHLCGSGPLEDELRERVEKLGLNDAVVFEGFLQTAEVAQLLSRSLALLLPSVEEQFGNVVIEAQALGLPLIVSDAAGARDELVRTGVNGFVVEPDNPEGLDFFMQLLSEDERLWQRMREAAFETAHKGDVARFAEAVVSLR